MDVLKRQMEVKGISLNRLAEAIECNRYILKKVLDLPAPATNAQREVARQALAYLGGEAPTPRAPRDLKPIPILGRIPAGHLAPVEAVAQADEFVQSPPYDGRTHYALEVSGNSMHPFFMDHDLVICRHVEDAAMPPMEHGPTPLQRFARYAGKIVCALVDGNETTLKRLEIKRKGTEETDYEILLQPLNPDYPLIRIRSENSFAVQGQVVRLIREL
jgi:SOS-response transcriptional repressor LexA